MTNKSKGIGTTAETAVCRYLKARGLRAKRLTLHGSSDVGDIDTGFDELVVEVKAGKAAETASDGQVEAWLGETDRERVNAGAQVGALVLKRKGVGPSNVDRWWVVLGWTDFMFFHNAARITSDLGPVRMHLGDFVTLLLDTLGKGNE